MRLFATLFSIAFAALASFCCPVIPALAANVPDASLKIPRMVPEQSVSTYIPSDTAPGQGLAVNVIFPNIPRYKEGAPVVVVAPGGESSSGLEFTTHSSQVGFAEVRFAFPGGGKTGFSSAGIYDVRGPISQQALRDVLLFAAGKTKDLQGRSINELVKTKLFNKYVGLMGWSNGGNISLITLSKYKKDLPFVAWLSFYETPLGSMFFPPSLGGSLDLVQNKHYRLGSAATGRCLIDFRKLTYQRTGQKNAGLHRKQGQPEPPGVLYFDENSNQQWDEEFEFAFPYCSDVGFDKQIYPPVVTQAMARLKIFGKEWPETVATQAESERYFRERDGSLYLTDVAKARPDLLVCVFASSLDHLQRQSDHPHVTLNYNNWLANRMKFVRLNPASVYVGAIGGMNAHNFVDNKPNMSVDADDIEKHLEPEGLVPDYVFMEAAISELSDRKRANNFQETLLAPLVNYSNGASAGTAK